MYGGPIHNAAFIEKILSYVPDLDRGTYTTLNRLEGMLHTAYEELNLDPVKEEEKKMNEKQTPEIPSQPLWAVDKNPFFLIPSALAKVIHCAAPSATALKGALRSAGYKAMRSHCKPGAVKTDAPWSVVWEVMREWVRQRAPVKEGAIKRGSAGWQIMHKAQMNDISNGEPAIRMEEGHKEGDVKSEERQDTPKNALSESGQHEAKKDEKHVLKIVFDEKLGRDKRVKRLVRYQMNPLPNWGPMNRAKGGV
jgi:tRNA (guanine26-N2/guanine27-N2)-dimethyltransferase